MHGVNKLGPCFILFGEFFCITKSFFCLNDTRIYRFRKPCLHVKWKKRMRNFTMVWSFSLMFIAASTTCHAEHNHHHHHHSVSVVFRNRNTVAFTLQTEAVDSPKCCYLLTNLPVITSQETRTFKLGDDKPAAPVYWALVRSWCGLNEHGSGTTDITVAVLLDRVTDASRACRSVCREFLLAWEVLHLADRFTVRDRRSQLSVGTVTLRALVVVRRELRLANDDVLLRRLPLPLPPPRTEQHSSSLMPFRKLRDMKAYKIGLIPELKYVMRNVTGVKMDEKLLPPS